jgi:hypothetical protein
VSYAWRGLVTGPAYPSKHPEIEGALFPHSERDIQSDIFTLADVITKLTESQRRAEGKLIGVSFEERMKGKK